jgi:hypothetical protein
MIATNHRDVVKLPWRDRRFSVITCGKRMTKEDTAKIRDWMAMPENIGALYRALLNTPAVPTTEFDPFGEPPPFAGRREMIGMGKSRLEDSYEAAIDALEGCPLFTMTQAQRLINYIGAYASGDGDRARHTVAKNAYRLRERDETDNRIRYRKRQEVVYARTDAERRRWREADTKMIVAALDRAEERVTQVINAERACLPISRACYGRRMKQEERNDGRRTGDLGKLSHAARSRPGVAVAEGAGKRSARPQVFRWNWQVAGEMPEGARR